MIKSIEKIKKGDHPCKWWDEVEQLKNIGKVEFTPGLNILVGPNGTGKTTLTRTLARMFCCEQSGYAHITRKLCAKMFSGAWSEYSSVWKGETFNVEHDSAPVYYFNPSDDLTIDDIAEQTLNACEPKSSGQFAQNGYVRILEIMNAEIRGESHDIVAKLRGKEGSTDLVKISVDSNWQKEIDRCLKFIGTATRPWRQTFIIDEPDRSMDMLSQLMFWEMMQRDSEQMQIIICAHNALSLDIPEANYIELEPGYIDKCRKLIKEGIT